MTENNDIKIARLEVQITDNKVQLGRVEAKLDSVITKIDLINTVQLELQGLRDKVSSLEQEDKRLTEQITNNLRRDALTKWVYPTLSAAGGAILAILINIAIKKP